VTLFFLFPCKREVVCGRTETMPRGKKAEAEATKTKKQRNSGGSMTPTMTVVDAVRSLPHHLRSPSPPPPDGQQQPALRFSGEYFGEKDVNTGEVHSGYRFTCPEVPELVLVKDNVRGTGIPWSLRWREDYR